MTYRIEFAPTAKRDLKKFSPGAVLKRNRDTIDNLANEPRPGGVTKLQGTDDLWRIRVGDYRIVYSINDGKLLVLVVRLGHRRDIYKN